MVKKPIPFPHLETPAEPGPIVRHHGGITIRLGSKRYAIEITTSARPLPPEPATVEMFPSKSKPPRGCDQPEAVERLLDGQRPIPMVTDPPYGE